MVINLQKNQGLNLRKGTDKQEFTIGLGWDLNSNNRSAAFDLDLAVLLLGKDDKMLDDRDLVYYNNKSHWTGAVRLSGDNRTGAGDGDDEQMFIDLSKIHESYNKIVICVTIYDAIPRSQNFSMVQRSYARIYEPNSQQVAATLNLERDAGPWDGMVFGEIRRRTDSPAWEVKTLGLGFHGGLEAILQSSRRRV